jgi:hypothetical protein
MLQESASVVRQPQGRTEMLDRRAADATIGSMRVFRLVFFALLFAAAEVSVPMVGAVSEAAEEVAEETPHGSARRRALRPARSRTARVETAAVQTAHRPVRPAVTRGVELNHRAAIRKTPAPSSSSPSPEDH